MIISFESNNVWLDSWGSLSITENGIFCSFWIIVRKKENVKKLNDKASFSDLKAFFDWRQSPENLVAENMNINNCEQGCRNSHGITRILSLCLLQAKAAVHVCASPALSTLTINVSKKLKHPSTFKMLQFY